MTHLVKKIFITALCAATNSALVSAAITDQPVPTDELRSPTEMHYLDPTFVLHNEVILWIMRGEIAPGLNPVPKAYDEGALDTWKRMWPNEDISELLVVPVAAHISGL